MSAAAYLRLHADGRLRHRAAQAVAGLSSCTLCARRCGADRTIGIRRATCRIGRLAKVASWGAPARAELCLAGTGEILFSGCNLRCLSCATWAASWDGEGTEVTAEALADIMLAVQERGHQRLMLASPSHVPAQILEALCLAADQGFHLPLAWQSGGYDSLDTIRLLDGIVDLYIPDVKHGDASVARVCTGVADYPAVSGAVVAEMQRQVGHLVLGADGVARRGLLVRHLVLPSGLGGTAQVLAGLPVGTAVSLSDTYLPLFRADRHPKMNRRPTPDEAAAAVECARERDLKVVS